MPPPAHFARREAHALALLRELGAGDLDHPGGSLLAHLERVHARLGVWGARPALRLAGLCHAFYGTDGFATALLPVGRRAELAAVIGAEAEEIVYFYASCDRAASYPTLASDVPCGAGAHTEAAAAEADADADAADDEAVSSGAPAFRDRFTGHVHCPGRQPRRDFAELTAANELDLARIDPAFRAAHGPGLLALFTRLRGLLTEPAWRECRAVLGEGVSAP
ncbi:hypothetical protein CP980_03550 [Streptomyces vinaceus]|uniref:DUF6817 domain-containing protein n=1 Tax=Streptomyces vinaceus TaxID=1960 RepID=A0A5J6J5X5_STRVI|nr:hypothetical protein [Streptomyces vinaceus]QEV44264.1 hypothetical protein CP980_03550 [Streptomyces vinaceus]GHE27992.1 hypothetical protein GCM10017778_07560 [Streptomyces vinaceus]